MGPTDLRTYGPTDRRKKEERKNENKERKKERKTERKKEKKKEGKKERKRDAVRLRIHHVNRFQDFKLGKNQLKDLSVGVWENGNGHSAFFCPCMWYIFTIQLY